MGGVVCWGVRKKVEGLGLHLAGGWVDWGDRVCVGLICQSDGFDCERGPAGFVRCPGPYVAYVRHTQTPTGVTARKRTRTRRAGPCACRKRRGASPPRAGTPGGRSPCGCLGFGEVGVGPFGGVGSGQVRGGCVYAWEEEADRGGGGAHTHTNPYPHHPTINEPTPQNLHARTHTRTYHAPSVLSDCR